MPPSFYRVDLQGLYMTDLYCSICNGPRWLEGLLDNWPLSTSLAWAHQLGQQVCSGILLPWDMHQLERRKNFPRKCNIPQVRGHLWVFGLVLTCDLPGYQQWVSFYQQTLSAQFFGQQHPNYQCFILSLVITGLEGKSKGLLNQQSVRSLQNNPNTATLLIRGSVHRKDPLKVSIVHLGGL